MVDTLAPKYLYRDYFKAKVSTIKVHGAFGNAERTLYVSALTFSSDRRAVVVQGTTTRTAP